MSNQRSAVPPLPAISGISDHNTRAALQSIYDFLVVRNGDVGSKDDKFVTVAELAKAGVQVTSITGGNKGDQSLGTPNSLALRNVSRSIEDLEDSVRASAFFTQLRSKIDRIDQFGAQVRQTQETLQSAFASLAQISTKLQAEAGNNLVLLEQIAKVSADLDGRLSAQWAVKIDINGYVSGFGLSSTANNDTPYSEFYIAADRFAIGSPGVPRTDSGGSLSAPSTANVPFIVITTPTTLNGKTIAPGVYMRDVFIQNGSIVTAMIGDLQVDTVAIQNNAVTIPSGATQAGTLTLTAVYQLATTLSLTYSAGSVPGQTVLMVSGYAQGNGSGTSPFSVNLDLRINGTSVRASADSIFNDWGCSPCISYISGSLGAGTHTIEVYAKTQQTGTNASASSITIVALGLKK